MLQAMGWQEGKGLGRHHQGITAPITVRRPTKNPFFFIFIFIYFFTFFLKLKLSSPQQLLTDGIYMLLCSFPTHKAINTVTWGATCVQSASSNDRLCLSPQASLRTKGTGLGIKGSSYELSASDTYKDAVRKAMFSRFTEIEWTGLYLWPNGLTVKRNPPPPHTHTQIVLYCNFFLF